MAVSYVLNTVFNAVNRFTQPATAINASMQGLNTTASQMKVRFNTLAPTLDNTGNKLMGFAKSTAIALGIMEGARASLNASLDYESALARFRIVVNELNDADFSKYEQSIKKLAKETGRSYTDIANAYESISQKNPDFAKTTASIEAMAKVVQNISIVTGEDSRSVGTYFTEIMTMFKLTGEEARKAGDILQSMANEGGASIDIIAQSLKNVGATAVASNLNLQQTAALFEALDRGGINSAEAGTKLGGAIGKMKEHGMGFDKNGIFDFLRGLEQIKTLLSKGGSNEMVANNIMQDMFGYERINVARTLLQNIEVYKKLSDLKNTDGALDKASGIIKGTLAYKIIELNKAFQNTIVDSTNAGWGMKLFGASVAFLTSNMDLLVNATILIVGALAIYKGAMALNTLWNSNFVQSLRYVIATIYKDISALWMQTAATDAQTAAVERMNVANTIAMWTLGALASFGIGMIFMAWSSSADKATASIENLDKSMVKLTKPKTDAQRQLENFLALQREVIDNKNKIADIEYNRRSGNTVKAIAQETMLGYSQDMYKLTGTPEERAKRLGIPYEALINDSVGNRYLDSLKSLMPSSNADSVVSSSPQAINYFSRTQNIERKDVKITIDNNSGNNVSVDDGKTSTSVLPFVGSTTAYKL